MIDINDTGIVGFYYICPIEVTDTVVEDTQLKSFDEIKSIFEEMIIIKYGTEDKSCWEALRVDNVVLRYIRISEADNFDSGLLVPVWDFIGLRGTGQDSEVSYMDSQRTLMSINAIDGSIIDYELGY